MREKNAWKGLKRSLFVVVVFFLFRFSIRVTNYTNDDDCSSLASSISCSFSKKKFFVNDSHTHFKQKRSNRASIVKWLGIIMDKQQQMLKRRIIIIIKKEKKRQKRKILMLKTSARCIDSVWWFDLQDLP
jgi:hypothetical protein